ncbi:MAG: AbrB/MazE/SpoVT family DNA-binding domain-containing protein [Chloroflexota bacterium]|nr:AbrB/MazE/SpoVT family DNA-binding domain-containing protein [Chloroflexota bacterium]
MTRVTTMTSKGQVTIPKEVRDELGLRPKDKIRFSLENGHVVLRKAYPSLAEVVGSLPPLGMPIEEAIAEAKEERARRLIVKMLRS